MDKKPDIGFEYDYIRIVYEVITLKLRTNKKIIEKEINYIGNKLLGIKKKPGSISENMQLIKTLIAKTENLQKKVRPYKISMMKYVKKRNLCTIVSMNG